MELSPRVNRNGQDYKRLSLYTWAACILAAVCVVVLIFTVWFMAVMVEDGGMAPTLERGDTLLCDKLSLVFASPKRGDIICYRPAYGDGVYTARIVALPGEEVTIYSGRIYINGQLLKEEYISEECRYDMDTVTIDAGSYFILPDARGGMESAALEELIINATRIIGRVCMRVAPIERIAIFE